MEWWLCFLLKALCPKLLSHISDQELFKKKKSVAKKEINEPCRQYTIKQSNSVLFLVLYFFVMENPSFFVMENPQ